MVSAGGVMLERPVVLCEVKIKLTRKCWHPCSPSRPLPFVSAALSPHSFLCCLLSWFILFYFFIYLSFVFLGPLPRHMEDPRLGVESELQPPAYTTATATLDA